MALLAMLSWVFGNWKIGALGDDYVPMAPSDGLMLICSVAAWLLSQPLAGQPRRPEVGLLGRVQRGEHEPAGVGAALLRHANCQWSAGSRPPRSR